MQESRKKKGNYSKNGRGLKLAGGDLRKQEGGAEGIGTKIRQWLVLKGGKIESGLSRKWWDKRRSARLKTRNAF